MRMMAPMPTFLKSSALICRHIVGLADLDVELVVGPDAAFARGVVEALFRLGDQLALRNDDANGDVLALIEELGRRILQDPVLLDHIQESIFREAGAVRQPLRQTRREFLDLDAALGAGPGAISHRPDLALAGADEGHNTLRADRHVARIGNKGIELNMEPGGSLIFSLRICLTASAFGPSCLMVGQSTGAVICMP